MGDPRRIGPYEIVSKLADGGVGSVFLAMHAGPAGFRRLVAIKRLHEPFAADPSFVTMFMDEARLAARIHHANVVSMLELGDDGPGYYVVMDYVEGSTLATLQWRASRDAPPGRLPRAVGVRIVLDALAGLHAAHELRDDAGALVHLVHRDVSPENVLVGADGVSRLGDFGIARAESLREFETRGARVKGKLEYMAPEQVNCKAVDRTTDLFALGVVLWEVLTGARLFHAPSHAAIVQRVCFDPIPSPRAMAPDVPPEIERVCLRALERPTARRYPTADAFAEDLERAARAGDGIATQREVAAYVARFGTTTPRRTSNEPAAAPLTTLDDARAPVLDLPAGRGAMTQDLPASDPLVPIARPLVAAPPAPLPPPAPSRPTPPVSSARPAPARSHAPVAIGGGLLAAACVVGIAVAALKMHRPARAALVPVASSIATPADAGARDD